MAKAFKEEANQTVHNNPVMNFIDKGGATKPVKTKKAGAGSDQGKAKPETKSVRVNLLFRPTTKQNIEKLAFLHKTSINDLINTVMDQYVEDHSDEIKKYDSFFND